MEKSKKRLIGTQIAPTPIVSGGAAERIIEEITQAPSMGIEEVDKGIETLKKMFEDKKEAKAEIEGIELE